MTDATINILPVSSSGGFDMPKRPRPYKPDIGAKLTVNTTTESDHIYWYVTVGRTYPAWLNAIAWPIIISIPIGLTLLLLGRTEIGAFVLFVGFVCIGYFGELAAKLGRSKRQVKRVGGTSKLT